MLHTPDDSRNEFLRTDSVSVLLFATTGPRHVTITGPHGLKANISLDHGLLRVGPKRCRQIEYASSARSEVVIASTADTRRIRGRVVISPTDFHVRIAARVSLADYLSGAIAAETQANDPIEYLVALAVLQRNYVDRHRGRHAPHADVCDNTHCQRVHLGRATPRIRHAVRTSFGLRVARDPCYYSASCGGGTLKPVDVWGVDEPGYSRVRCQYCRRSRWHRWWRSIRASPGIDALLQQCPSGTFVDEGLKIALGRATSFGAVPSNTFDRVERRGRTWRLYGRGFGHRVGLCQEGAAELARAGRNARAVLNFYFPAP